MKNDIAIERGARREGGQALPDDLRTVTLRIRQAFGLSRSRILRNYAACSDIHKVVEVGIANSFCIDVTPDVRRLQ